MYLDTEGNNSNQSKLSIVEDTIVFRTDRLDSGLLDAEVETEAECSDLPNDTREMLV